MGHNGDVLSAIILIVVSQVVLAALLFGTAALDRPSPLPLTTKLRRREQGPYATMQAHQRRLDRLGAASERSRESLNS